MQNNFDDADDVERVGIHDGANPRGLHARAGAAEELGVRMARPNGFDQPRGVEVAGGFACGDEDAHGSRQSLVVSCQTDLSYRVQVRAHGYDAISYSFFTVISAARTS